MKCKVTTVLIAIIFHGKQIYGRCCHNTKRENFMKNRQKKLQTFWQILWWMNSKKSPLAEAISILVSCSLMSSMIPAIQGLIMAQVSPNLIQWAEMHLHKIWCQNQPLIEKSLIKIFLSIIHLKNKVFSLIFHDQNKLLINLHQ